MNSSAFQLGEAMSSKVVPYILHKPLWDNFLFPHIDTDFSKWTSIKYLNDDATGFSDDIGIVPNDKGGLYLFYLKCPILSGMSEYPFYIGRAQYTKTQNLRKRIKEYYQKYLREDERPKVTRMLTYWGTDLYVAFLPIQKNLNTRNLEKSVINSLLLPMNDEIPDKKISTAKKSFNL